MGGDEDTPESGDERGQAEDDQEEPVQDPGYFPPLLAYYFSPLLCLVFLLHDDGTQVFPRILRVLIIMNASQSVCLSDQIN